MDRRRLDSWCEKGILALVLAILIFGPVALGAVWPREFLLIQFATLGVLLLWVARVWLSPSYRLLWPPICWAVVAFALCAIVRYCMADVEYAARRELDRILVYASLFLASVNNLHRAGRSRLLTLVLVALATGVAIAGVYQYIHPTNQVWGVPKLPQYFERASGTYDCPNHFAGFLEMILPLALAFTFLGRLGHVAKIALGYAALVMLAGIALSLTRGAWVATAVALAGFFLVLGRQSQFRLPALAFFLLLTAAITVFAARNRASQERFAGMFVNGQVENVRFQLWRPAVQMWEDHFWLGVGPGHFDIRFRQYRAPTVQARPVYAHNDYLNTLADWGVVGTSLVLAAWGLLGVGVVRVWKHCRSAANGLNGSGQSNRLAVVLGAATGLVALLVHSLADYNMQVPANAILAITLMAILTLQWRQVTDRYWIRTGPGRKVLITLLCLAAMVYLGFAGARRWQEDTRLRYARQPDLTPAQQVEALKQAFAVEPGNASTAYRIGEILRLRSWQGNSDYAELASEALKWFEKAIRLNPFDPYPHLRYGMCLDWLDKPAQALPCFERARRIDPYNHYVLSMLGWHYVQIGDYASARKWFQASLKIMRWDNPVAESYLAILSEKTGMLQTHDK